MLNGDGSGAQNSAPRPRPHSAGATMKATSSAAQAQGLAGAPTAPRSPNRRSSALLAGPQIGPRPSSASSAPGASPTGFAGRPASAPAGGRSSTQAMSGGLASSGGRRPESASSTEKRRPESAPQSRTVEREGPRTVSTSDSTILWNTDADPNDISKIILKKRRQKLTNEELKEIVVTTGDTYQEVMGWFRVFEFYCDPVVDPVLPSMPAASTARRTPRPSKECIEITTPKDLGEKCVQQAGLAGGSIDFAKKLSDKHGRQVRSQFDKQNSVKRWSVDGVVDAEELVLDLGGGTDNHIWEQLIAAARPKNAPVERPKLKQMPATDKGKTAQLDATSFKRVQSAVNQAGFDEYMLKTCQGQYLHAEDWKKLEETGKDHHEPTIVQKKCRFFCRNASSLNR